MVYIMINERELLEKEIAPDSVFKTFIVNYVGNQLQPKDGRITVEMIVEVLAKEFPELVLVLAEENYIRGYTQGLEDAGANSVVVSGTPENGE
jgi:hypothetical protein